MEIFKSKKNHANPVGTAKSNFYALGFFYILMSVILFSTKPTISIILLVSAVVMLIAAYLLSKNKVSGVYLGWAFIAFGVVSILLNGTYAAILILAYLAYWNQMAFNALSGQEITS